MEKKGQKAVLRMGFEDEFTILFAERTYKVARVQEGSEEVEWSDDPVTPPQTIRVNTIVLLSVATFVATLLTAVR